MSIGLTWSSALLGAVALIFPLLIHLLPRRQSLRRRFAALRFIGTHASPRRQRRISEWPLLLLRSALLALLLLWLAGPVWRDWPGLGLHWRALWPGVSLDAIAQLSTNAHQAADRSVWLKPGFPDASNGLAANAPTVDPATPQTTAISAAPNSTASLLRELSAKLPPGDRLSVFVPAELDGLDAGGLSLAREVHWQVLPSDQYSTGAAEPRRLALRIEENAQVSRWLSAALLAWESDPSLAVEIERGDSEQPIPADTSALIWLGDAPAPRWQGAARPVLQIPNQVQADSGISDPLSRLRWRALAGGDARLAGPLNPEATPEVLDADFPQRLHRLVFARQPSPQRAPANSVHPGIDSSAIAATGLDLRPWLAVAIALLLLVERWLASGVRLAAQSATGAAWPTRQASRPATRSAGSELDR